MRTLIILCCGFGVWLACLGAAYLFAGTSAPRAWATTIVFAVLWFLVAATNMWIGVTKAGYTFMEELPIFLLIFLLPVAIAVFIKWKMLGA